jgi:hypothetical protein
MADDLRRVRACYSENGIAIRELPAGENHVAIGLNGCGDTVE